MQAIIVSVPVRRPFDLPPMKKIEECVAAENPSEGGVILSTGNSLQDKQNNDTPKFHSLLPEGVERTMIADIDIGMICRVDDLGKWNEDGTFTPTHCIVYFRIQGVPPLEVEMLRVEFMNMISMTTQSLFNDMRKAQMGSGLAIANGPIPNGPRIHR